MNVGVSDTFDSDPYLPLAWDKWPGLLVYESPTSKMELKQLYASESTLKPKFLERKIPVLWNFIF